MTRSVLFGLACCVLAFTAGAQQNVYWEATCLIDRMMIGQYGSEQDALRAAQQHSMQTGHQTQYIMKTR